MNSNEFIITASGNQPDNCHLWVVYLMFKLFHYNLGEYLGTVILPTSWKATESAVQWASGINQVELSQGNDVIALILINIHNYKFLLNSYINYNATQYDSRIHEYLVLADSTALYINLDLRKWKRISGYRIYNHLIKSIFKCTETSTRPAHYHYSYNK